MNNNQFSEAFIQLAKCWNHQDTEYVSGYLADDLVYDSQWVLATIKGKVDYLEYLKPKFELVKKLCTEGKMSVVAELANLPGLESTPVIILTQVQQKEIVKISILVEEVDGKITHISFCAIPDPHSALLSGVVPF